MSTYYEQRPDKLFIGEMTHYPVAAHVHSEAELLVLTRGSAVMTVDGETFDLNPGDAVVIFPLVSHSYDSLSGDIGGLAAIFSPAVIPEFAGTFHDRQPEKPLLPAGKTSLDVRLAEYCAGQMNNPNYPIIRKRVSEYHAGTVHFMLLLPICRKSLREIKDLDKRIRAVSEDVYRFAEHAGHTGALLRLMRRTAYVPYWGMLFLQGMLKY